MVALKRESSELFWCSATIQKTRAFCAQSAHDKYYRHERMDWHTNFMPLLERLDTSEFICFIRIVNETDSPELNQFS